jgi:DNA-binding LacI/PurR family transcriptional regulator
MEFDAERTEAVKTARRAMEKAMTELRRLERETIPAAEADLKKAEEAYQRAASALIRNPSARSKVLEAETAQDEARRRLDGLRQLAREAKLEGERLTGEYSAAIREAEREEARRLLGEAKTKFREIAARWNAFAASVRDLVLLKKALNELGEEGRMPSVSVAQQLNFWAAGRFVLEGMPGWDLEVE